MATTTTALPTLSADDAERLARETQSYLMLVDAFRAEDIEPAWGAELEPRSPEPVPGCDMECESSLE
jgi:hypothetical protein